MARKRRTALARKPRRRAASSVVARSTSLWWDAAQMMMGAGEVITRRMDMLGKSARGETPFDFVEISRMWQEKFAAGLGLAFALNRSAIGSVPMLFTTTQGAADATAVLDHQLQHLSAALKPYASAVKANRRRLRSKK